MPDRNNELWVFVHGEPAGVAVRSRREAVLFSYRSERPASAVPLSLSVPHGRRAAADIGDWMDGLLPDNDVTRARWVRALGAGSARPFDLLSTPAGLECAGAVQFHTVATLPEDRSAGGLERLSDTDIAAALRLLTEPQEPRFEPSLENLRLSLPGAQPKMALRLVAGAWHLPTGTAATSHVFKPQRAHLNARVRQSVAVNEHLCQSAAALVGLDAAATTLESFEGEVCLVSERFDRRAADTDLRRVHSEDVCQALGYGPRLKYQADGGPTPEAVLALLGRFGRHGAGRPFFMALVYSWLIGNTDAHAKNYGVILGDGLPRLAPLYDLVSSAPYAEPGAALPQAMRFAGSPAETVEDWTAIAKQMNVGVGADEIDALVARLPQAFVTAVSRCPPWAAESAQRIGEQILAHAAAVSGRHGPRAS